MAEMAPISLYLDLEEGQLANIEVVARAALAWSAAIKELAYVVDPSIEIEIDLVSGTEGSLGLNACVKAIGRLINKDPKLKTIIITSLTWFTLQTGAYTYEKILDWLTGANAPPVVRELSQKEIEQIAQEVVKAQQGEVAAAQRKQVFHELSQDQSIIGVGATQEPGKRPISIIPRSEFSQRAGQTIVAIDTEATKRAETGRIVVVLVSPTLKDAERRWRFQAGNLPEFGATMKDHEFLAAVAAGRVALPLRAGIEMEIELETKLELSGELWTVKERNVLKVYRPGLLPDPNTLPFPPRQD